MTAAEMALAFGLAGGILVAGSFVILARHLDARLDLLTELARETAHGRRAVISSLLRDLGHARHATNRMLAALETLEIAYVNPDRARFSRGVTDRYATIVRFRTARHRTPDRRSPSSGRR